MGSMDRTYHKEIMLESIGLADGTTKLFKFWHDQVVLYVPLSIRSYATRYKRWGESIDDGKYRRWEGDVMGFKRISIKFIP